MSCKQKETQNFRILYAWKTYAAIGIILLAASFVTVYKHILAMKLQQERNFYLTRQSLFLTERIVEDYETRTGVITTPEEIKSIVRVWYSNSTPRERDSDISLFTFTMWDKGKDAWGNPVVIRNTNGSIYIGSMGRDGKVGGGDDFGLSL